MLQDYLTIKPLDSRAGALRVYVPLLLANRGMAFLRLLLVAGILGASGKREFANFQIGLEFINWLVPVILLGVDSIAERYAARQQATGHLASFLRQHLRRTAAAGAALVLGLAVFSGPLAQGLFPGAQGRWLVLAAAADILIVALYQWVAAALRGLRAYQASAGMETMAAVLLVLFSIIAAGADGAVGLLLAYGASTLVPLLWYGRALYRFAPSTPSTPSHDLTASPAALGWFGRWSQIRLILSMTVGLVALRGVEYLSAAAASAAGGTTADYALSYRVAQLLMYVAVTLWSSTYALAAARYSAGGARPAQYQFVQMGKLGGLALLVAGICLVAGGRVVVRYCLPAYGAAVGPLLGPMVGLFYWYALLAFLVSLGDLQERPWAGAALWAAAVLLQLAAMVFWHHRAGLPPALCMFITTAAPDGSWAVLWGSVAGAGVALLLAGLLLRRTAGLGPIGGLILAGGGFFLPRLPGTLWSAAFLLVLASSGLLLRRREWLRLGRLFRNLAS